MIGSRLELAGNVIRACWLMNSRGVSLVIAVQLGHRGGPNSPADEEEERPFSSLIFSNSVPFYREESRWKLVRAIRVRTAYATLTRVLLVELPPVLFRRRFEFLVTRSLPLLRGDRVSENISRKPRSKDRRYRNASCLRSVILVPMIEKFAEYSSNVITDSRSFTLAKRIEILSRGGLIEASTRTPVICPENASKISRERETLWKIEASRRRKPVLTVFARCIYIYIYLTSTIYWLKSKVTFRPRIPAYVNIIPIYFTARFRGFRCPTFLGNTVLNHTKYLLKISTTSLSHSLSLSLSKSTMLPDINHRGSYLDVLLVSSRWFFHIKIFPFIDPR